MTYRVWLTKAAKVGFKTTTEKRYGTEKEITRFCDLEVYTENTNAAPYISIERDPIDPTVEFPVFPKGSVRKVTYIGKHFDGFRNDGVYHYRGATARLETTQKLHTPSSMEDKSHLEVFQQIQISARCVRTLREIYTKVRSGTIQPTEDWGSPAKAPSLEEMLGLMALVSARAHGRPQTPTEMN